jgi:hypothetical protein
VVVACVDTAFRALDHLGTFDLLWIDESHHAPARLYLETLAKLKRKNPALRVGGGTATPERGDLVGLDCVFGKEAAAVITLEELFAGKWLVRPRVRAMPLASLADLLSRNVHPDDEDALSAALNAKVARRELVRLCREHTEGRRTIVYCQSVRDAMELADDLRAAGEDAVGISHETHPDDRVAILDNVRSARGPRIITNPILLVEGFDAPPVDCIVLARWIASRSPLVQQVGRGLRPWPGKVDCLVIDPLATFERVGGLVAGTNLQGKDALSVPQPPLGEETGEGRWHPVITIGFGQTTLQSFEVPDIPAPLTSSTDEPVQEEAVATFVRPAESVSPPPPPLRKVVNGKAVIARAEAMALGLPRYFTGRPCPKGHVAERHTRGRGACVACGAELAKERARRNMRDPERREQIRAQLNARAGRPGWREQQRVKDAPTEGGPRAIGETPGAEGRLGTQEEAEPRISREGKGSRNERMKDPEYRAKLMAQKAAASRAWRKRRKVTT